MHTYKKNDVIKVNIQGTIVSGIVLSDLKIDPLLLINEKFLISAGACEQGYRVYVCTGRCFMGHCCYEVLIGDQKVYMEEREMHQNETASPQ